MAVDYIARKAAKKGRKRDALVPRRERKKKQARRLCRGPCYQDPKLSAEDLDGGQPEPAAASGTGELAKYATLSFGEDEGGRKGKAAAAERAGGRREAQPHPAAKAASAAKPAAKAVPAAKPAPGDGKAANGKKRKLSTAINLLDAKAAKTEAPRQRQLQASEVSPELSQFPDLVQRFMAGEGFPEPMPVQSRCWPVLLEGRDVEAVAEPGSGKTLAYVLPAAALLVKAGHGATTRPDGPLALVLLPTRELAQQVASACRDVRKYSGLRTCCITGGIDKQTQAEALSKQPHILVATPGRLLDLVQENSLQLGHVRYVILDEADKMLGLGFQPQIDQLKALLLPAGKVGAAKSAKQAPRVQVGLFTATKAESLDQVAAAWLHRPERIQVSLSCSSISASVTQVVQVCAEHKKPAKLIKHMAKVQDASKGMRNPPRALVFTNRIKTCRFVHRQLQEAGHRVALLHGERSQEEREAAMADFRSGKAQVLVATDVAARGLHVARLAYLVNYDFPADIPTYVHRVGRTGRLATDGHAFSFFTREMARLAPAVVDLLQQHAQDIDPNLEKLAEAWKIAAEKLGLLADAAGEAAAPPQKEDVLRQLGMKTQQQKKRDRQAGKQAARKAAGSGGAAPPASDSGSDASESEGEGRGTGGAAAGPAAHRGRHTDEDEAAAPFIAARAFTGARPGYAFKKGPRGLGFYLDAAQQPQQAGAGKRQRAAAAAKQQQKEEFRQLKQRYTHAPIGGTGVDGARPAAGAQATAGGKPAPPQAAKQQQLPGRLKELKRQRQAAAASGQLAGFSSDEEEAAAPPAPVASKRPKALPGRLRRKLSKQRGSGGGD